MVKKTYDVFSGKITFDKIPPIFIGMEDPDAGPGKFLDKKHNPSFVRFCSYPCEVSSIIPHPG